MFSYTDEQKAIVESNGDQLRVIASPGSGKTTVIIGRIVELIKRGVSPEHIFVLCFAKHDKKNIISRLSKILPFFIIQKIQINNYHSYSLNLIRQNGIYGKSGDQIKLIEESESYALIRKNLESIYFKRMSNDKESLFVFKTAKKIGIVDELFGLFNIIRDDYCIPLQELGKNLGLLNSTRLNDQINNFVKTIEKRVLDFESDDYEFNIGNYNIITKDDIVYLAESYGNYCEKHGYVDFMDMILQAYLQLKRNPFFLEKISAGIQEVLVDEFQDISYLQFELVSLLTEKNQKIFAVGDIDQCLYEWRNSKPRFMKDDLPKRYPNLISLPLTVNFRSDANVINAANSLIIHNKDRLDITMIPFFPAKEAITIKRTTSVMEQGSEIADLVEKLLGERLNYYVEKDHKIAIIVRSARSVSANIIRNALFKKQIPVQLRFESKIIEKVMSIICSLCNLIIDPNSPSDLISILNILPGFGEKTIVKIRTSLESGNDLLSASVGKVTGIKLDIIKSLTIYLKELNNEFKINENIEMSSLILFNRSFHITSYLRDSFAQGKGYLENTSLIDSSIEEIKNSTEKFINYRDTLTAGLASINQIDPNKKPAVLLCTTHHAKGGEWETVICPDLVIGGSGFPIGKNLESEEERRIFYVAITRAMKKLYLYHYNFDIQKNLVASSPYLRELGLSQLINKNNFSNQQKDIYKKNPDFKTYNFLKRKKSN